MTTAAATPKKSFQTPSKSNLLRSQFSPAANPVTPQTLPPRRSTCSKSLLFNESHATPKRGKAKENPDLAPRSYYSVKDKLVTRSTAATSRGEKSVEAVSKKRNEKVSVAVSFAPVSPGIQEEEEDQKMVVNTRVSAAKKSSARAQKKRSCNKREDATSDEEDPEVEECRMCFRSCEEIMIECDNCLGGFHLKCLKPPLKDIPEGHWICGFCEAPKMDRNVDLPKPPRGKKLVRLGQ